MKKFILIILILLVAGIFLWLNLKPQNKEKLEKSELVAYKNESDGFWGIKWGTDINQVHGFVFLGALEFIEEVDFYKRQNDIQSWEGIKIKSISYGFWRNKFYEVMITFPVIGRKSWDQLKMVVISKFGMPTDSLITMNSYSWKGSKTEILLMRNTNSDTGILSMQSKKMTDERRKLNLMP